MQAEPQIPLPHDNEEATSCLNGTRCPWWNSDESMAAPSSRALPQGSRQEYVGAFERRLMPGLPCTACWSAGSGGF